MADEKETGVSREDTGNVEESLFGDAAPDTAAAVSEEETTAADVTGQEPRGSDDANEPTDEEKADKDKNGPAGDQTGSDESGPAKSETDTSGDLKIVVSVRGRISTIGVQRPSSDPHVESVADLDVPGIAGEVPAVVERAKAKWEEAPKYPAYERPAASTGRRSRRGQGSGEDSAAEGEAAQAQQTLKLF